MPDPVVQALSLSDSMPEMLNSQRGLITGNIFDKDQVETNDIKKRGDKKSIKISAQSPRSNTYK